VRHLRRIVKSFRFAGQGVGYLLQTQPNFWVHCLAALLVGLFATLLGTTAAETGVLLLAIGLVLVCEAFNSALEALVDLASPGYHELAKTAKDVSAAAVLIAAAIAAIVGLLILGPRLWHVMRSQEPGAAWGVRAGPTIMGSQEGLVSWLLV
jgi:diacylglycerol kinase (ATP)